MTSEKSLNTTTIKQQQSTWAAAGNFGFFLHSLRNKT